MPININHRFLFYQAIATNGAKNPANNKKLTQFYTHLKQHPNMKNILIIGGSYGIGQALIEQLQTDYQLFVGCRTTIENATINYFAFDAMTDTLDLNLLPEKIDGFVYLPGSIVLKPFKNLKSLDFESDFQINFIKMIEVLQSILPRLQQAEFPSIVLFSSVGASVGMPFHTSVAASKAAIEGFAKAFAAEFAPKIRINVVAPSLTHTPLADKFLNNDLKMEKASERHPLKRVGQPEDLANMVSFLLSDKSSWITGQVFGVDGGMSSLKV